VREIKFDPVGFVFLDVYIKPALSPTMERVNYKVDSGANCTTISHSELEKLGYDKNWIKAGKRMEGNARPTLASGIPIDDCYEVVLPEIRIGDWVGYNWPFMTSLSVQFKFLLGTDSMQFFNWNFDYGHGACKFNLIPGKRKLLFNQKEQSIHSLDDVEQSENQQ